MKNFFISISIFILFAVPTAGQQTRSRVFDNFDTSKGVQVVTPRTTAVAPIAATNKDKKPLKKTAQQTMTVQDSVGLKSTVQKIGSIKLSMSSGKSLGSFTT